MWKKRQGAHPANNVLKSSPPQWEEAPWRDVGSNHFGAKVVTQCRGALPTSPRLNAFHYLSLISWSFGVGRVCSGLLSVLLWWWVVVAAADAEGRWPAGRRDAACQWPLPEMQELKEGVRGLAGGPQKGMKIPPRSSKVFSCPSFSSSGVGFFLFPRRLKRHPLHPCQGWPDGGWGHQEAQNLSLLISVCAGLSSFLLAHFPNTLLFGSRWPSCSLVGSVWPWASEEGLLCPFSIDWRRRLHLLMSSGCGWLAGGCTWEGRWGGFGGQQKWLLGLPNPSSLLPHWSGSAIWFVSLSMSFYLNIKFQIKILRLTGYTQSG